MPKRPRRDAEPIQHEFVIKNFKTESGVTLPEARIVYGNLWQIEREGRQRHSPALALHGGDARLWLVDRPGASRSIRRKLFLITSELFGNGRSSSPEQHPGNHFMGRDSPVTTIRDNVQAVHSMLTEQLHVRHLRAVIGFSMGAQQAFQWAVSYPRLHGRHSRDFRDLPKTYGHGIVRLEGQIAALYRRPGVQRRRLPDAARQGHPGFSPWCGRDGCSRRSGGGVELWRSNESLGKSFDEVVERFRTNFHSRRRCQ